jgi:hypothetical protein
MELCQRKKTKLIRSCCAREETIGLLIWLRATLEEDEAMLEFTAADETSDNLRKILAFV